MSSAATIAALTAINASNNASGSTGATTILAFYLALLTISLAVWIVSSILWFFSDKDYRGNFLEYVFLNAAGGLFTIVTVIITALIVFALLIIYIEKLIS
jgi:hypothetical protein